jgi:hypothetical protein
VLDAWRAYSGIFLNKTISAKTDTLTATWHGEWARFDGANGSVTYTSQVRNLYIPVGATKLVLEMQYIAVNLDDRSMGTLGLRVDTNGDGSPDYTGSTAPTVTGTRKEELDVSDDGIYMGVDVTGQGFALRHRPTILPGSASVQYWEVSIEYAVTATLIFGGATNGTMDNLDYNPRVVPWQFGKPSAEYKNGTCLTMLKPFYDKGNVSLVRPHGGPVGPQPGFQWWVLIVVAIVVAMGLGWRELKKRGLDKRLLDPKNFRLPKKDKSA